jgi:hypothetical protein
MSEFPPFCVTILCDMLVHTEQMIQGLYSYNTVISPYFSTVSENTMESRLPALWT